MIFTSIFIAVKGKFVYKSRRPRRRWTTAKGIGRLIKQKPPAFVADGGKMRCKKCSKNTVSIDRSGGPQSSNDADSNGTDQASFLTDRAGVIPDPQSAFPVAQWLNASKILAKHSNGLVRDSDPTSMT